ncbi:MAG TPA: tetratricopeptide repeat protein [Rhodocyclaceae bacterium]|nr:tetratricopeptide repeat protein [Rhodocyclaceae bacterium]
MTSIRLNTARLIASLCSVASIATLSLPSYAQSINDINKTVKEGKYAAALEQVDKYLAGKPKDAQARFLKGIVLTEMNKPNEAIAVFTRLTEDYPELPEPYNNLAVIYAQQKNFEKAKQSLEMAIRTHPSYATAHENLGDVYARLASQAYDKALQIDSANASAQSKLALIRELMSRQNKGEKIAKAPEPMEPIKPSEPAKPTRPSEPSKPTVAVPVTTPTTAPPTTAPAPTAPPTTVATTPTTTAKPIEPAKPKPAPAANAEIAKALDAWTSAWSRKDVKRYLAAYARDFKTPGGETRSAWETERKRRIDKPGAISVDYEDLDVVADGDKATVRFRQHYKSAGLKSSSNKVLQMIKRDNAWQIQQERVGR